MPRYFFHVCDGKNFDDLQGTVLPNIDAAKKEAVRFCGHLLAEKPETFWEATEWKLRVTDEKDLTLFELHFLATDSAAIQENTVDV